MKTMIKQKQTITRRFLKYLILIIIGSNLIVAMFLYWIMRENAMKQAENLRQSLMESTLVTMQQYFENVDNIADTIIYNEDIIHFMRNKEDTIADMALIRGIEWTGTAYIPYRMRMGQSGFPITAIRTGIRKLSGPETKRY